ncbi:hypothetical protein RMSM_02190 [Rhodopirellula maiorica SM1]|uniref:Uncharacterized protein n=1 Tax=Rhodopirellula maiorica SM1 TaxID=1265738 RepID=M5RNW2_9BACT|nr:hypothetical protein RMSM_02190 [Rhodopirellula maiorica SM1]
MRVLLCANMSETTLIRLKADPRLKINRFNIGLEVSGRTSDSAVKGD